MKASHNLEEILDVEIPIDADDTGLFLMFALVDFLEEFCCVAVGDLHKAVVYFRGAGWVEGVCVEVEGAGLVWRLEDVGDVGEEDVVEEVAEEGSDDAAFRVVAFPPLVSIPAQAHGFHATFAAAFPLIDPDCLASPSRSSDVAVFRIAIAAGRWVFLDPDAFDGVLYGFC